MPAVSYPPIPLNRPKNDLPRFGGAFFFLSGCALGRFGVMLSLAAEFSPRRPVTGEARGLRSTKSMTLNVDHFTPLSRAVASIDRDSYAARFAVYDREHKALLRRLATAEVPCSDVDIAREERAFRDAIRRIEFADEDNDQPTL